MTRVERIRRRQKICIMRRNIILTFATALLVGIFALSLNAFSSSAQDKDAVVTYKYFTSITVEYGDTLYSLAEEYTKGYEVEISHYIEEVQHINHLEDEVIHSGQQIIIPYYSNDLKGI